MSWSISAAGKAAAVRVAIATQVATIKCSDAGETETAKLVGNQIDQSLSTFDPEGLVSVEANGSMGFKDWSIKLGPFQSVSVNLKPIHLTV